MDGSYKGRVILIDLSSGSIKVESLSGEYLTKYGGGRGAAAKILWDEVDETIEAMEPENIMIFSTGVLTGTHAPMSGRSTVTSKSPATGRYFKTSVGGHWGLALKMAGYDHIVIKGKADKPVYIYITPENVEIRDASSCWGKGVKATNRIIKNETSPEVEIACIGPAGENGVKFASIMFSYYNAAARGGIGSVMGSKNLKAIAVVGDRGRVSVVDPENFQKIVERVREELYNDTDAYTLHLCGTGATTDWLSDMSILPSYNFKRGKFPGAYYLTGKYLREAGYLKRKVGCAACIYACHRFTTVDEGPYAGTYSGGPEYETLSSFGSGCGVSDIELVLKANEISNDMGMDTISAGVAIQWAMECYERGIITKEDTGGIDLSWGSPEALTTLLEQIAKKEGFGKILAEGLKRASEIVGKDSWKWAVESRGLEHSRVETRGAFGYALAFALNPRGPDHLHTEVLAEFGLKEESRKVIKKITGSEEYAKPYLIEKRAEIVKWHEEIYAVTDSAGLCAFTSTASFGVDEEALAKMYTYATGYKFSPETIMKIGRRTVTLERCYNIREGHTRKDDTLPWRIMNEVQEDLLDKQPEKPVVSQEVLNKMLDDYYELVGWDKETGWPRPDTLRELGLDFCIDPIWKRGDRR